MLFTHSGTDNRALFRFNVIRFVPVLNDDGEPTGKTERVYQNWSMDLYADDKVSAIKRFVAMTSPTIRFEVVNLSEA